jgi:hypothetical protein
MSPGWIAEGTRQKKKKKKININFYIKKKKVKQIARTVATLAQHLHKDVGVKLCLRERPRQHGVKVGVDPRVATRKRVF